MYILKNAITSIVRNKGRNILIGIVIIVIAASISITLAINNTSASLINSYKNKYATTATIGINRENMMKDFDSENKDESRKNMQEAFSSISSLSVVDIKKFANSKYVKSYYYTMQLGVNSSTLEKASMTSNSSDSNENDSSYDKAPDGVRGAFSNATSGDFTLIGYSSIDAMNEFIEGSYKITSGKVPTNFDSDTCLINKELATLNNISVGDKITITDPDDSSKTYELEVAGIFEEESNDDNGMSMFSNSVNTIITNTNFVTKLTDANSNLKAEIKPTFTLTSSKVVSKFESELKTKGLDDNLTVETNLDRVENATKAISNVKTFATTFLIITIIIGTIVLFIINMINIRERKYEIGVLRTIGMKKSKVVLQFLCELLIVSAASLLIGAGLGACLSVPVSNHLLQNEISESQSESENIAYNFGHGGPNGNTKMDNKSNFQGVANVSEVKDINAVVDFKVLAELFGIGIVITLISCSSAITSIERFSPLTILKERS